MFAGYENIQVALGMHPEIVSEKRGERELLISSIAKAQFVGEIGMDGSPRCRDALALQEDIFRDVLQECESTGGRVMSIHSRNAAEQVLDLIDLHSRLSIPVLHWFSGTLSQVRRAVALGCWFSVGPAMIAGGKGKRLVAEMPRDRLLPESDGPFVQRSSRPVLPWEVLEVVDGLASLWSMERNSVALQINQNLSKLLSSDR
jgi:TatD DNase family protein